MKNCRLLFSVVLVALSFLHASAHADVVLSLDKPKLPPQFNAGLFEQSAKLKLFVCKDPVDVTQESTELKPGCSITIDDVFYEHIAFVVMTQDVDETYGSPRSIQMVMTNGYETYMQFSREHKFEFSGSAMVRNLHDTGFTWE